ncbi:MAG: hypothetical protein QOI88_1516 [Gammaproteobacteria bacterium]|jgi:hypothetical protein|nr:hypothetical protein [Gammaproteobacteria bacterium]
MRLRDYVYNNQPLNEVSLIDYRRRLVEMLIGQHGASQKLRVYGSDRY